MGKIDISDMEVRNILIALSNKNDGNRNKLFADLQQLKDKGNDYLKDEDFKIAETTKCITYLDRVFPDKMKKSFAPPLVLYYDGDIELLYSKNILCVAGSKLSKDGEQDIEYLLKNTDIPIAVGLSFGTNTVCKKVVELCSKVILVLPFGINFRDDETANETISHVLKKGGLVITEYPRDIPASSETHIEKNRVLESFSDRLLVVETQSIGSSIILTNLFVGHSKQVLVLPKRICDKYYNNELIFEGADPCYSREQLMEENK